MKKTLQIHKRETSASKRRPSADQVTDFLENFRELADPRQKAPTKLISIKVEVPLLEAFRAKAGLKGIPYQTQIKILMRQWLAQSDV